MGRGAETKKGPRLLINHLEGGVTGPWVESLTHEDCIGGA